MVKNLPANARDARDVGSVPGWGQEDPLEKEMDPTPVFLPGETHGQSSVASYSLQGRKQWDTTDHTCTPHSMCRFNFIRNSQFPCSHP